MKNMDLASLAHYRKNYVLIKNLLMDKIIVYHSDYNSATTSKYKLKKTPMKKSQ